MSAISSYPSPGLSEKVIHPEVMNRLTHLHEPLADLIEGRTVHYVDVPVHGNIGDLLIMLGTLAFFEKHHIRQELQAAFFNYDPTWAAPDKVIVFQGGGNFGDLYAGPQALREKAAKIARDSRIIVLPQTIHFRSQHAARNSLQTLAAHPDLHLFVRDQRSLETASEYLRNVYLAPDMAHHLWRTEGFEPVVGKPTNGPLAIIRTDQESAGTRRVNPNDVTDWPKVVGRREKLIWGGFQLMRAVHNLGVSRPLLSAEMAVWTNYAKGLCAEAVELVRGRELVVTDRLHGHILSCLLDIRNTVRDNDYGKNFSYVSMWTEQSDKVSLEY